MKLCIQAGATSQTVNIFIQDSSSTTGAGLTGLVFNTASLTAYYALSRAAAVSITLATLAAVTSSYSSGGFKEIDATNMPGWYRFDIPDAALASGRFVSIHLKGATNMAPLPIEIELTAWNNQDAVRGGMTALPNASAEAAGGLYTRGTGAGQIAQQANGQIDINLSTIKTQTVTCAAGVTVLASVGTAATSTAQTGDSFARLGANGVSLSAIPDLAGVTTLLSRLTSARAGYLDNVNNAALATTSAQTGDSYALANGASGFAAIKSQAAAIEADTQDIQSRLPAALTGDGNMKSDALRLSGSATAADNLEAGALGLVPGTCAAGSTTTAIVTNLTEATDDHYNGRVITFTSGALAGQSTSISDYNGTSKTLTVVQLTEAPADTDSFVIS